MELILNFLTIAFTTYWLWLSIPVCIFLFFYTIHLLIIHGRKKLLKTWKINDIVHIKHTQSGDNIIWYLGKNTSTIGKAVVRLKKWVHMSV